MQKGKLRPGPGVYVRVCKGDFVAGIFLYQMAFLMQRARVTIDGKRWYVRTRWEAMDYWGCSERKYKNAMRFLRDEELIETRYTASFGSSQALRTTAFRLTEKAENEIAYETQCWRRTYEDDTIDERTCDVDKEVVTAGVRQHPGRAAVDRTDQDGIGPIDRDAVGPPGRDTVVPTQYNDSGRDSDRDSEREGNSYLRRESAAKKTGTILEQEDTRKERSGKISGDDIEQVFRGAWVRFVGDPHAYWAGWPRKNFRAARLFVKRIQERPVENGRNIDPLAVIDECVTYWRMFREYAFDKHSHKLPEAPNMLSLLGGIQPAVEFYLRHVEFHERSNARPKFTLATLNRRPTPPPLVHKEVEIDSRARGHHSDTQTVATVPHGSSFVEPRAPFTTGADTAPYVDAVILEEATSVEEEDDPSDMPSVISSSSASPGTADIGDTALAAPKRRGTPINGPTKRPQASDTLALLFEEPLAPAPAAPAPVTVNASEKMVIEEALSVEDEDELADIPSTKSSISSPFACAPEASLASTGTTKPRGIVIKNPKKKTLPT